MSHFEFFDKAHVANKFPDAALYLTERLGLANTRRRQVLIYNEKHHKKISSKGNHLSDIPENDTPGLGTNIPIDALVDGKHAPPPIAYTSAASTKQSLTTVSTVVPREILNLDVSTEKLDDMDVHSITSYAPSALSISTGGSPHKSRNLSAPEPINPDLAFNGEPFQCEYCYEIIKVADRLTWVYV